MKVQLRMDFARKGSQHACTLTRVINMEFAPSPELHFVCTPWPDPKKPEFISYDCQAKDYYVFFGVVECGTDEEVRSQVREFQEAKWRLQE
jgi:hypothetical protein